MTLYLFYLQYLKDLRSTKNIYIGMKQRSKTGWLGPLLSWMAPNCPARYIEIWEIKSNYTVSQYIFPVFLFCLFLKVINTLPSIGWNWCACGMQLWAPDEWVLPNWGGRNRCKWGAHLFTCFRSPSLSICHGKVCLCFPSQL